MPNISTLTVNLVAETARFTASLKKSRRDADKFGRAVKKITDGNYERCRRGWCGFIGYGTSICQSRGSNRQDSKSGWTICRKRCRNCGLRQSNQALIYADSTTQFRRFNRRLGEFATSGGRPVRRRQFRISASVFEIQTARSAVLKPCSMTLSTQWSKSKARRSGQAWQRSSLATTLDQKLTPLLDKGTAGIEELRKEARDLGIVLSNETVAGAERAEEYI